MATSSAGITTDPPEPSECEICTEGGASFRCQECEMDLCVKCEKGHKRVPATRNHTLKQLSRPTKVSRHEGSASYDDGADIYCSTHTSKVVTMICEPCAELICPVCTGAHSGHKTVPISTDIHNLQDISMGSLQKMITGFKDLGLRKKNIVARSNLYGEAANAVKNKGAEIIDTANAYIDLKCKKILAEKKDIDSKTGPLGSVSDRLTKTDGQISKLNMIKTSTHRTILLHGIQQSTVTQKLNYEFMNTSKKYKDVRNIDSILPNIGRADDVKELLKSVFNGGQAEVNFSKFELVGEQQVGAGTRRIQDDATGGYIELVLFDFTMRAISVLNESLSSVARTQSETNIPYLVKISDTQFVSAYRNSVELLNTKYQVVKSKKDKYDTSKYHCKTICSNDKDSILEFCIGDSMPYKLNINQVDVRNNDFISTNIMSFDVGDKCDCYHMHCRKLGNTLVFAQETQIHIIDLKTKAVKQYDVSDNINGRIRSVSLDAPGYILVGDVQYVHVYRESMDYVTKLDVAGEVHGIVFVNDTLFVSRKTHPERFAEIQKYKIKA